jgi:hypothetical protein
MIGLVDQRVVDTAIDYVTNRFPYQVWAGAAGMYTEDGELLAPP